MVMKKASNGMAASNTKNSATVQSAVSSTGKLILLIVIASAVQFMVNSQAPLKSAAVPAVADHKMLQAARPEQHPESYYDETSSHYMGGAHNAALKSIS
jgi:hypothetical protein